MVRNRVRVQPAVAAGLVMAALLLAAIAQAGAAAPRVVSKGAKAPRVVSIVDAAGNSPFAGLTCNIQNILMQPGGREGEPHIAVNPRDPENRIAAWMDRTRGTVNTAYTDDGGLTWHKSIPLGLDGCTGNAQDWEAVADIWVSYSPDGASAYLTSLPYNHAVNPPFRDFTNILYLQRSDDGGATWSAPVLVPNPKQADDKPMSLVDQKQPETVYVVDVNEKEGYPIGDRGTIQVLFHRSRDGGKTFDIPNKVIFSRPDLNAWIWNTQLVQLKDGALVLTHALPFRLGSPTELVAWRSEDQGETWSGPRTVTQIAAPEHILACDAEISGASTFLTTQQGQSAVVHGSTIALVTVEDGAAQNGPAKIIMSTSTNGGIDWQSKTIIESPLPITLQSIAANRRGQLGVVYDQVDVASANCSTEVIPARTIFSVSSDKGQTWSSTTVGPGWWNFGSAANNPAVGWWLGEYQSLAGTPDGFTTITPQGAALTPGRNPAISGAIGVMVANITTCPRGRHSGRHRCSP